MARTKRTLLTEQPNNYLGAEFEVFGKVQGVYFRNHTKDNADRLGVVGWVSNSDRGTILGEIQGEKNAIIEMMAWLQNEGSPASVIQKTVFVENWYLPALRYSNFEILQIPHPPVVKGERGGALKEIAQRDLIDTITFFNPLEAVSKPSRTLSKAISSRQTKADEAQEPATQLSKSASAIIEHTGRVPTTFLKAKPPVTMTSNSDSND